MLVTPDGTVQVQVSELPPIHGTAAAAEEDTQHARVFKPIDSEDLLKAVVSSARQSRFDFRCSASAEFVREEHRPIVSLPLDLWAPSSFALGKMIGARFDYAHLRDAWVALDSSHEESRFSTQLHFGARGEPLHPHPSKTSGGRRSPHIKSFVDESSGDSEAS